MTVEKIITISNYQGQSNDEKPTGSDAPTGSTFHAIDTGDEFVRYADGWTLDLRKAAALKRTKML